MEFLRSLDDEDNDYEKESQPQALRHEWHKLCRSWVIVPELSESKKARHVWGTDRPVVVISRSELLTSVCGG